MADCLFLLSLTIFLPGWWEGEHHPRKRVSWYWQAGNVGMMMGLLSLLSLSHYHLVMGFRKGKASWRCSISRQPLSSRLVTLWPWVQNLPSLSLSDLVQGCNLREYSDDDECSSNNSARSAECKSVRGKGEQQPRRCDISDMHGTALSLAHQARTPAKRALVHP